MIRRSSVTPLVALAGVLLATYLQFNTKGLGPGPGIWIGLLTVYVLPGFLALRLLFPEGTGLRLAELPIWVVFSLAIWAIPASVLQYLHLGWAHFQFLFLAFLWSGVTLFLVRRVARPTSNAQASVIDVPEWLLIAVAALVAVIMYRGPRNLDDWFYLGIVQQLIKNDTFQSVTVWDPRYSARFTFQVWLLLQAFVSRTSDFDPVTLVRDLLPALTAPLALFSFYGWARELLGTSRRAWLAVGYQLLIYATSAVGDGWGYGFFVRSAQDKFVVWLIVFPIALLFFWRFMRQGRGTDLAAYILSVIAIVFVHPIGVVQLALALGGAALFNLVGENRFPLRRWALTLFWLVPALAVPLIIRAVTPESIFGIEGTDVQGYLKLSAQRLILTPPLYLAHPQLIANSLVLLGIGLLPLLTRTLKTDPRIQFLWGSTLVPLAILFNPLTAWLLGQAITPWQIWRMTWILPVALIVAQVLAHWRRIEKSPLAPSPAPKYGRPALVALMIVGAFYLGTLDLLPSLQSITRTHTLGRPTEDVMRALPRFLSKPSIILVPSRLSRLPEAFSPNAQVFSRLSHRDIRQFYAPNARAATRLDLVRTRDVNFVIVEKDSDTDRELKSKPDVFVERYTNTAFVLYEVQKPPASS